MKGRILVYNEITKRLEFREEELGWKEIINPFTPYKGLWEAIQSIVNDFNSPKTISQNDSENIIKTIEEGRKQKVDVMEIEISQETVTGLNVKGIEGVDITFGNKGETKCVMKVKYKYK